MKIQKCGFCGKVIQNNDNHAIATIDKISFKICYNCAESLAPEQR